MRLEKKPEVAGDAAIAENNTTVTLYPATKDDLLALVAIHSTACSNAPDGFSSIK